MYAMGGADDGIWDGQTDFTSDSKAFIAKFLYSDKVSLLISIYAIGSIGAQY